MPELPEVETVKRGIVSLCGNEITNVTVRHHTLRYKIDHNLHKKLVGKTICAINRRAKYLVFDLNHGFLLIHLGMSGRITLLPKFVTTSKTNAIPDVQKHDHVDIETSKYILRYNDPRRFGLVLYFDDLSTCNLLRELGVEPLSSKFSTHYLAERIANKNTSIKQLIMDNHIVVGVGNIYACEALFLAGIAPMRPGKGITLEEVGLLVLAIKQVLKLAIKLGGSSLRDYKQANGSLGMFQNTHNVYGRANASCVKCGTKIVALRLGQRNSFYCPSCQR